MEPPFAHLHIKERVGGVRRDSLPWIAEREWIVSKSLNTPYEEHLPGC